MKRTFFILITLGVNAAFAQSDINATFSQDVATVFTEKHGLPANKALDIKLQNEVPIAFTEKSAAQWDGQSWKATQAQAAGEKAPKVKLPQGALDVLAIVWNESQFAVGCRNGLYLYSFQIKKWQQVFPADQKYSWAPRQVAALAFDSKGRLWFGAEQGVGYLAADGWHLFTGKEGLPYNHFTCAAAGPNGIMWFGTEKGAIRVDGEYFYYRQTRRWLPNDHVNAIVVQKGGTAWFATDGGVGRIAPTPMTLEQKAAHFQRQVEARHNRDGFVIHCRLKEQFNPESWQYTVSDNDGLYTSWFGASQAFRYAVTSDPEAKALAIRSFKALKWLVDITHEPGFPARAIIPVDWPEPVNEIFSPDYNKRSKAGDPLWKDIYPRFPLSKDGRYRWKCDTSSDELSGHYFFYGVYYELVAQTEEERQPVREVVAAITDHLIRHDFNLIDYDGTPTRWGRFGPDFFNTPWGWEQRGLNSMMMLSFLKVAKHITGDAKYDKVESELREKQAYHLNALESKQYFPPENVVPWDKMLCLTSWYGLINYEEDPELLLMYRMSLEYAWLHESKQKNAVCNVIYGALADRFTKLVDSGVYESGKVLPQIENFANFRAKQFYKADPRKDHIIETLQRMPLDLIGYKTDNTHRLDVVFDMTPGQQSGLGWRVDGYALPIDELGHLRPNRDAFALFWNQGDGYAEFEGTFFLLPYYMARYHGILQ